MSFICYNKKVVNILIILVAKYFFVVSILIAILSFFLADRKRKKDLFILALFTLPVALLIAKISGHFINDPRPFVVDHIKPLIAHAADNGFPSDHTLLTMTLAAIVFAYNKKFGIILFIIALLVGTARVLAHIHHPLDIFGATVIAIGTTGIVFFIKENLIQR